MSIDDTFLIINIASIVGKTNQFYSVRPKEKKKRNLTMTKVTTSTENSKGKVTTQKRHYNFDYTTI